MKNGMNVYLLFNLKYVGTFKPFFSRKQAQSVTMPKLQAWSRLSLLGYVLAACSLRKQGAGCAVLGLLD